MLVTRNFTNSIAKQTRIGEKSKKLLPSGVLFNKFLAGSRKTSVKSKIIFENEFELPSIKSHDIITLKKIRNSRSCRKNIIDRKMTNAISKNLL